MKKSSIVYFMLLTSFLFTVLGCGEDGEDDVGDAAPPTVTDLIVAGETSAAATNGPIILVFSEAIDPASIHTAITCTPHVNGSASYDAEARILTFKPTSDLQAHTMYSINVCDVADKAGNVMEACSFDILTSEKDVTPPKIVKTIPGDGDSEVPLDPRFGIHFSERVDQARFGQDISTTPDLGVPMERWLFTWSGDGRQVEIFIPLEKGLEPERKHNLRIGITSVADLVGNKMESSLEIEFTTSERPYEDINPVSATALQQEWIYIIWKDNMDVWHISWGGVAPVGATTRGQGTIFSKDGDIDDVTPVAWEAGDTQNLSGDGVLTFSASVNGTGGVDGLEFKAKGKTVTFKLYNAKPEWIFIGKDRKHPVATSFTLLNEG
jgi:hypothetical protein